MTLKREEHGQDIQDVEDTRRAIAKCTYCGTDIKAENEDFYADVAYSHGGVWSCEDCVDKFLEQFRVNRF